MEEGRHIREISPNPLQEPFVQPRKSCDTARLCLHNATAHVPNATAPARSMRCVLIVQLSTPKFCVIDQ